MFVSLCVRCAVSLCTKHQLCVCFTSTYRVWPQLCADVLSLYVLSLLSAHHSDGQLEECHRVVPALQQAGVSARGDGRHDQAQGHQSQRQQVSQASAFLSPKSQPRGSPVRLLMQSEEQPDRQETRFDGDSLIYKVWLHRTVL